MAFQKETTIVKIAATANLLLVAKAVKANVVKFVTSQLTKSSTLTIKTLKLLKVHQ